MARLLRDTSSWLLGRGLTITRIIVLAVFLTLPALAAADPIAIVNALRSTTCHDAPARISALQPEKRLNDAAKRLAEDSDLASATAASGYHAKLSASIRIRTLLGDEGLSRALAERFCDIVGDAELAEIGAYQHGPETWFVLATPFTPLASVSSEALNERVLKLINQARQQARRCGGQQFFATAPLSHNRALEQAARGHATDMAQNNFIEHEGSSGSKAGDRATSAGYDWASYGENIAAGQTTAEEVVASWLASARHCATLMNPRYAETGIAHAVNRDAKKGTYWVQIFAAPRRANLDTQ